MTKPAKNTPRTDSLPAQVLAFFARNPEESLTLDDISDKFDCTRGNIHTQLRPAVEAGHLVRQQNDDTEWVYKAGPAARGAAPAHLAQAIRPAQAQPENAALPTHREKAPKRFKVTGAPPKMIDIEALVVEDDVPYMDITKTFGASKWAPLFAKLTKKGQSVQLPHHVKKALQAAIYQRNKKHPATTYRLATVDATTVRVWRTA